MTLIIIKGAFSGRYGKDIAPFTLRQLLDYIGKEIDRMQKDPFLKVGPVDPRNASALKLINDGGTHIFNTIDDVIAEQVYGKLFVATRAAQIQEAIYDVSEVELNFDDKIHGQLHFIKAPTENKSAWDLDKVHAIELMENEVKKYLQKIYANTDKALWKNGWEAWLISGITKNPCGRYYVTPREHPKTRGFTIEIQINWDEKVATYHGYPDEKVGEGTIKTGYGRTSKNMTEH